MKTAANSFLVLLLLALQSCALDPHDINLRFAESMTMSPPANSLLPATAFSFIHITDLHYSAGSNPHLPALAAKLLPGDAFIIASGDLTDSGQRVDYDAYSRDLTNLGLPVFSAAGNHDLWNNGWSSFRAVLGPSVYSTVAGNVRIIVLDSADDSLGPDQYRWLQAELAKKTEPYCIVVSHYNMFAANMIETSQSTNREEVYGMMRLFEQYRVNYVLMGHSHIIDYRQINGVSYLVGPALNSSGSNASKYFFRLSVSGGQMTHQLVNLY